MRVPFKRTTSMSSSRPSHPCSFRFEQRTDPRVLRFGLCQPFLGALQIAALAQLLQLTEHPGEPERAEGGAVRLQAVGGPAALLRPLVQERMMHGRQLLRRIVEE